MQIGYYVHHHGGGHLARARAIAAELKACVTLIGTGLGEGPGRIDLPDDRSDLSFAGQDGAVRPSWLHYAPLHHRGVQQRNARISAWIEAARPELMVVDVSVEIACLARLCGVPVITIRLPGERNDPPHLGAFHDAVRLIAPFPEILENPATPDWIVAKTFYAGYLAEPPPTRLDTEPNIVVLLGRGGTDITATDIAAAAAATPARSWVILGHSGDIPESPPNLRSLGWVADPGAFLTRNTILVGGGGDGTVGEAAAAGCRFICIPQTRPYAEQQETARALGRIGAAICCAAWPAAQEWNSLLENSANMDPAPLAALHDPMAARRTADFLRGMARSMGLPADTQYGVPGG